MPQASCCGGIDLQDVLVDDLILTTCEVLFLNGNVCNTNDDFLLEPCRGVWHRIDYVAYVQLLIVVRVWREYGNLF